MLKSVILPRLREEGIPDAVVLPYDACRVTRPYLLARLSDFTPRSVILFLVPYYAGPAGNLYCYASARDYHAFMKELFGRICPALQKACGYTFHGFADHSPIDERHAAAVGGLGILGKNGLIMHPRYGSFVFVGELFTDAAPDAVGAVSPGVIRSCAACGACAAACPGGCLRDGEAPCLSHLTQKKGVLSEEEKTLVRRGGSAWGCDICQTVCPHNQNAMEEANYTPISYFRQARITRLTKEGLLAMPPEEFAVRAFSFRGKEVLLRNLDLLDT